jgi:hypothetical protein
VSTSPSRAILFDRSITVNGTNVAGRLTLATRSPNPSVPATDITISGNLTRAAASETSQNVIGLLAENDILISAAAPCTTRSIDAAMVAMAGGVSLPQEHRPSVYTGLMPPTCANLDIDGSISSHASIVLRWQLRTTSMTPQTVGFTSRAYRWDPWLGYYPPPYFPLARPWELITTKTANRDCFTSVASTLAPGACK